MHDSHNIHRLLVLTVALLTAALAFILLPQHLRPALPTAQAYFSGRVPPNPQAQGVLTTGRGDGIILQRGATFAVQPHPGITAAQRAAASKRAAAAASSSKITVPQAASAQPIAAYGTTTRDSMTAAPSESEHESGAGGSGDTGSGVAGAHTSSSAEAGAKTVDEELEEAGAVVGAGDIESMDVDTEDGLDNGVDQGESDVEQGESGVEQGESVAGAGWTDVGLSEIDSSAVVPGEVDSPAEDEEVDESRDYGTEVEEVGSDIIAAVDGGAAVQPVAESSDAASAGWLGGAAAGLAAVEAGAKAVMGARRNKQ